ncbi:MAG: hypothetical protein ACXVZN_10865 [Gaiellaceae bacterium]
MPDRRGLRFLLEALFLAGLAAALALARLRSAEIVGAMAAGWVLVAFLEWAAWRGSPHYGSGLPPRYYVPRLNLPPAPPVQAPRSSGFPTAARAQETMWMPSPAPRTGAVGDWPLAVPPSADPRPGAPESDPWLAVSLPVAPIEREPQSREAQAATAPPAPAAEPDVALATWSTVKAARARQGPTAFHSLDPLAERPRRRRGGSGEEPLRVEVSARPPGVRRLPSRWRGNGRA